MEDSGGVDQSDNDGPKEERPQVDKSQLLLEAKSSFTAKSSKSKKLVEVLTKCIFMLLQGEELSNTEATDLFMHITRLFQHKDTTLRRLTYIGIKALSKQADNVYVVTSSLTTDVNSCKDDPAVRASALRALCHISDAANIKFIESYIRQSIIDKHPVVASAALTSLIRAAQKNREIVAICKNEIQEALKSDSPMVQYHALALSFISCKHDRLATSRLLVTCIDGGLKSPLAICLLLRIISSHINESSDDEDSSVYIDYLTNCLSHKHQMVEFEAANTIVSITKDSSRLQKHQVPAAISHLRNFLSASKPALRFAAVRLLNQVAATSQADIRFWSVHRIGSLCILHLLNRRYKPGDDIIGVMDFTHSRYICAKYTYILQCEEIEKFEMRQEFSLGLKQNDFVITIPLMETKDLVLHCVLSFLFYIADKNYPKSLFEDKAGTIELGPNELETKLFSCDFPIAIYT